MAVALPVLSLRTKLILWLLVPLLAARWLWFSNQRCTPSPRHQVDALSISLTTIDGWDGAAERWSRRDILSLWPFPAVSVDEARALALLPQPASLTAPVATVRVWRDGVAVDAPAS